MAFLKTGRLADMDIVVRAIPVHEARPIRHAVLRSGLPFATAIWAGDDAPDTRHFGAFSSGELTGVATLLRKAWPGAETDAAWQLRGMAVLASWQRHGIGTRLLEACITQAREEPGALLWCNARASARAFYERMRFSVDGEAFEVPEIGPHYRMIYSPEK